MKVKIRVAGWAKLVTDINQLEKRIARGAMREALTKSGRIMTAAAKSKAPVGRTGLLKKSIKQKITTNQKRNFVTARIGASTRVQGVDPRTGKAVKPAKYLHLVEFGSATRGVWGHEGYVMEPGNDANPFMRQSFEATKKEVKDKYNEGMITGIKSAAAKIYKTSQRKLPNR